MAEKVLPFTVEDLDKEEASRRVARGLTSATAMVLVTPGDTMLPKAYRRLAHAYYTFQFRSDDTLLMAYPKCGNTWTMEILWALRNVDRLHLADATHIHDRIYYFDQEMVLPNMKGNGLQSSQRVLQVCSSGVAEGGSVLQLAAAHRGSPRLLATHLSFALLAPTLLDTCKVVYVVRNPKDVCLSLYNFLCLIGNMTGELRDVADLFMAGDITFGSYWAHLQQAWQRRGHPNLHIIFFEDLKVDLQGELRRLSDFLQVDVSDEQLVSVMEHVSLEKMRAREKTHPVFPSAKEGGSFFHGGGKVGGWAANAPQDLDAKMDKWVREESNKLGISFRYT